MSRRKSQLVPREIETTRAIIRANVNARSFALSKHRFFGGASPPATSIRNSARRRPADHAGKPRMTHGHDKGSPTMTQPTIITRPHPQAPAAGNPPAPASPETIPGFENMSFAQQRQAQDQLAQQRKAR
jgi:hypothetical protein